MIFLGNWRVVYQQVAILLAVGVGASSIVMSEFSTANLTLPSLIVGKGPVCVNKQTEKVKRCTITRNRLSALEISAHQNGGFRRYPLSGTSTNLLVARPNSACNRRAVVDTIVEAVIAGLHWSAV